MVLHGIVLLALARGLYLARHLPTLLLLLLQSIQNAMHFISSEAQYQYVCHCSVYCIDSVDAVRTDYNHTNPSISAFIRHFSRKLERITITIYGTGSQTTENEDNSVIVRT